MPWTQNYAPLGGLGISAVVAALPVVTLLALLGFWHVRVHLAALIALAEAALLAMWMYGMPAKMAFAAALFGAAYGLFPIGWIIFNAIFIYYLSVETGGFAVLQTEVAALSGDRRIQALLIAFSFGAFIETGAGFGAPIAITGALMIGLGFKPLEAAKLALIGNTAPVAFGSLGIPVITLAKVTGLDVHALSAMVGRQLPVFALLVPFWLVTAQVGWRGMLAVWPACLVCGASFGLVQFAVSNFHGPYLVDLASSLASIFALGVLLKFWQPSDAAPRPSRVRTSAERAALWRAARPWLLLTVFVFIWGFPGVKPALDNLFAPSMEIPALHHQVQKMPPVVDQPTVDDAVFSANFLSATGTALLLAGLCAGLTLGQSLATLAKLYWRTLLRVRLSLLTIALMLALGYVTRYSGSDSTMGLALAATGAWFPFFSPLIGWMGVALTGSDTSSNVLFGNLQKVTAHQIGLSPILAAAANSSGGVMGKMIDAQSIVVASVATGGRPDSPHPGAILRAVFWHSLGLALLMALLVLAQARLFSWMIPPG